MNLLQLVLNLPEFGGIFAESVGLLPKEHSSCRQNPYARLTQKFQDKPRRSRHLHKSPVTTGLLCYLGISFIVCVLGEICFHCLILVSSNLVSFSYLL